MIRFKFTGRSNLMYRFRIRNKVRVRVINRIKNRIKNEVMVMISDMDIVKRYD